VRNAHASTAALVRWRTRLAFAEVGLEVQAADGDGAAVHPAHHAGAGEGLQVAAYGLGGDLELLGEPGHVHPAPLARPLPARVCYVPESVVFGTWAGGYARDPGK
jgi:hypothetical protein